MGKKKFINKKKSATFTLVYRESAADDDATNNTAARQFTRVDGGDSFIPGFSEDDPRSQTLHNNDDDEFEHEHDDFTDGDSKFDDADENSEDEEEKVVQRPSPRRVSSGVGTSKTVGSLPENVRRDLIELGFPDDGYDYNQHMRRIGTTSVGAAFVPSVAVTDSLRADIKAYDASNVDVEANESSEATMEAVIELVSSRTRPVRKPLSKVGVLDADIISALENSDGSQFDSADELEDEFVVLASEGAAERTFQQVDGATTSGRSCAGKKLKLEDHSVDGEFYDDEEDEVGELPERPERATRLLDERFETLTLHEYDDFQIGELDEDNLARGNADISQFSSVLSEFLEDKNIKPEKYETVAESSRNPYSPKCKSSYLGSNEVGGEAAFRNMVINKGVDNLVIKKILELEGQESEEEVVASVISEEDRDEWDCETVVSTYSNLDNHPAKISAPGRSKLRPKLQHLAKDKVIRLGGKHHLPVDYLPGNSPETKQDDKAVNGEAISSGKVAGPRAGETPEEKKARKASFKEHRREARLAKKTLKSCFREESCRAQHGAAKMGPKAIHLP